MVSELKKPEPAFKLHWDGERARYTVSKPNIGDTDCYTAAQLEQYAADRVREALENISDEQLERMIDARTARMKKALSDLLCSKVGTACGMCHEGRYVIDGNGYHEFNRCGKCGDVPMWDADGQDWRLKQIALRTLKEQTE